MIPDDDNYHEWIRKGLDKCGCKSISSFSRKSQVTIYWLLQFARFALHGIRMTFLVIENVSTCAMIYSLTLQGMYKRLTGVIAWAVLCVATCDHWNIHATFDRQILRRNNAIQIEFGKGLHLGKRFLPSVKVTTVSSSTKWENEQKPDLYTSPQGWYTIPRLM